MSMFRRMLMSSIDGGSNYIANFTLKFDSSKQQYISGGQDNIFGNGDELGVGFSIYLNENNHKDIKVTFKNKETGNIIAHSESVFRNDTYFALGQTMHNIVDGLYEVEVIIKPKDSTIYYINDISVTRIVGVDKSPPVTGDCYCLYSINNVKPNPDLKGEGISINLTSYTESA